MGAGKQPRIWGFQTQIKKVVEKKVRDFFIFHIFFDHFEHKILKNQGKSSKIHENPQKSRKIMQKS